jgi:DNA-binding protein HU-beta
MTKDEFVTKVAEKTGLTKKDAAAAVNAYNEALKEALVGGEKVSFIGFGTFYVAERAARTGRNPRTGEPTQIAASKSAKFKQGKAFKDALNTKKPAKKAKAKKK